MGNEQTYKATLCVDIGGRKQWRLEQGEEQTFLRGVPSDVADLREQYSNGIDVFIGDRFGWDGHYLRVEVDGLEEIVEALTTGQLPARFVEEVQRTGTEYHAPCGGG